MPIDLGDDTGRDSILLTFMFGSSGTLLEYSKLEASNRGYSGATFCIWALSRKTLSLGCPSRRVSNLSPQLHRLARKLKYLL